MDHAIYATKADGARVRVSDPMTWPQAQARWNRADNARREGRYPHVRHFEVRSLDDPKYAELSLDPFLLDMELTPRKGFSTYQKAAHAAWIEWQGKTTRDGKQQGRGGWFYWHSGRTAAQGLYGLEHIARQRGMVATGVDGRFYPLVTSL